MKKTKFIIITSVAVGILAMGGVLGALGLGIVSAQESLDNYPLIIQNLAKRFNLDADEVNQVFEDTKETKMSERLDQSVEDSTITEEQRDLIIEKYEEMHNKMEEINNQELTREERKDAIQTLKEELRDWAEENDIPLDSLVMRGGRYGPYGKGFKHGMMGDF